jgi:hypothetical protein
MRAGRLRRRRLRTSRSKLTLRKASKRSKAPLHAIAGDHEATQGEPAHSLLLSSLRYWEVERDLIEERMAGMAR